MPGNQNTVCSANFNACHPFAMPIHFFYYHFPRLFFILGENKYLCSKPLGRMMGDYSFFSYETNEALHLSPVERQIIMDCFGKIQYELNHPIDRHSKNLITDRLAYCTILCRQVVSFP